MTPKRWHLLAVSCLGLLAYSGREAQAQAASIHNKTALNDLESGYEYAVAACNAN